MDDEVTARGPGEKGKPLPFDRTGRFLSGSQRTQDAGAEKHRRRTAVPAACRYVRYHIDDLDDWSGASGDRPRNA